MNGGYDQNTDQRLTNPVMGNGWDTQHAAAAVVFGAMLFLFLIRRGFRGLNVGGLSVNVR
jgi:hypothetical protein